MFRRLFMISPVLFYTAFVDVIDWTRILAVVVFVFVLIFAGKLRMFALPLGVAMLIIATVFSELNWFWGIGTLFSFSVLLFWNETHYEPERLLFYVSLSWLILIGFFGGILAVPMILAFLAAAFFINRRWIAFLPILLLVILPQYSPDFFSSFVFTSESQPARVFQEDLEPVEREASEVPDTTERTHAAQPGAGVSERSSQQILRRFLDISLIILGLAFAFVGIRLLLGLKKMTRKSLSAMIKSLIILSVFLGAVFLFLQTPPITDVPEIAARPGERPPVIGIPQTQIDQRTGVADEADESPERQYSVPFGLMGGIAVLLASIVAAALALRWLLLYFQKKKGSGVIPVSREESPSWEEDTLMKESGVALLRRIYVMIRKKLFPAQDHLTPLEVISVDCAAPFRKLTDEYIRVEYGFLMPRFSDDELKEMMHETLSHMSSDTSSSY